MHSAADFQVMGTVSGAALNVGWSIHEYKALACSSYSFVYLRCDRHQGKT